MDASDYLYWFCDFCLSFGKILWSQKQNLQTIFTETTGKEFLLLESVERFSRDLLANHKEEEISWNTFKLHNHHTAVMFPWYFQLQPEGEILVVVVIIVIAPKKPRGFRTLMSTFHHFFTIIKFVHTIFFFFFIDHRQLLQSVVKDKHPFHKKKKITRMYILDFKGKQKCNVRLGHFSLSCLAFICL